MKHFLKKRQKKKCVNVVVVVLACVCAHHQVYDTTLDIELSGDRTKWLDDFGLKGPSPVPNPRSWDKSPVANGAHYFL